MSDSRLDKEMYELGIKYLVIPYSKEVIEVISSKDSDANLNSFSLAKDKIIWILELILATECLSLLAHSD